MGMLRWSDNKKDKCENKNPDYHLKEKMKQKLTNIHTNLRQYPESTMLIFLVHD
jgi:hypothetical protein